MGAFYVGNMLSARLDYQHQLSGLFFCLFFFVCVCVFLFFFGYLVIWLFGYLVIWLFGYLVISFSFF